MTDAADPITGHLCAELKARAGRGLQKYGVTLDAAKLTPVEILQHAKEEALDLAAYLQKLITTLESQADRIANAPRVWKIVSNKGEDFGSIVPENDRAVRMAVHLTGLRGGTWKTVPIALVELTEEEARE